MVWGIGLLLHQVLSRLTLRVARRVVGINFLALLLIGVGVGSPWVWSRWQERQIQEFDADSARLAQLGAPEQLRASHPGLTDRGRVVALWEKNAEINVADWIAAEDRKFASMKTSRPLVRTALPDPGCNCHGWVFTGGRYWIDGDEVVRILKDNGYYKVTTPEVGDLIVYASGDEILHSGVVRSVGSDGTVLIESKWGMNSRMLHAPEVQPNWQEWQFYHTSRPNGHQLRLPASPVPSNPAESTPLLTADAR